MSRDYTGCVRSVKFWIWKEETYMAKPTTQYVAYQKLTSPPNLPPGGGYHGITRINTFINSENTIATFQVLNSVFEIPSLARLRLIKNNPNVVAKAKTLLG